MASRSQVDALSNGRRILGDWVPPEQHQIAEISRQLHKGEAQTMERQIAPQTNSSIANLRSYDLNPERLDRFPDFYQNTVIPWLKDWGVQRAQAWTITRTDRVQLLIACSPEDPPWDGIEGLGEFLIGGEVPVQPRPEFSF